MAKHILFITDRNTHGGSLKMFVWLANAMSEFYDVWYCNLSCERPFYDLKENVKFIEVMNKQCEAFVKRNTIGFLNNIKDVIFLIKNYKIDIVVNYADHVLYSLIVAKWFVKYSLLISQRVDPYSCKKRTDIFRHGLYRYADGLACQTAEAQMYFSDIKYNKTKKAVIANPALRKTKLRWSKDDSDDYIISLARIDMEQKRQDILVDAMKIVHEKYPKIKLYFYGCDVDHSVEILNKKIKESGLEGIAVYCGITKNQYGVLSRAKMLVMASDYEGIPNAIVEAMEIGLPVISTDCKSGGARMLIDSSDKGIIVERNNPAKIARAIIYYLENMDIAAALGENARKSLSRFDERKIALEWKDLIDLL